MCVCTCVYAGERAPLLYPWKVLQYEWGLYDGMKVLQYEWGLYDGMKVLQYEWGLYDGMKVLQYDSVAVWR